MLYEGDLLDRLSTRFLVGDDCWRWLGRLNGSGYGTMKIPNGPTKGAHVIVYELLKGSVPENLELDHLCRNKSCVRPDHLEPVTRKENIWRNPLSQAKVNAAKTVCSEGHPYDKVNTVFSRDGRRKCRICINARNRESYHRRNPR